MVSNRIPPALHPDYEIDQRVLCDLGDGRKVSGSIAGVGFQHIVCSYIVILDEPMLVEGWDQPWKAIVIPGGQLTKL